MDAENIASFFSDIIIFTVVLFVEAYIFFTKFSKLETHAVVTLLLYLSVAFIRFLRCFIDSNRQSPIQIGIELSCHTLMSMTMYYFTFEMQAVVD